ncbi:NAD(P)/FAD-dependent oxidoreductase [Desertivirga arenae]|uniref:NAD(P)/FAD-dependent oxidoreductase n=1 Tax=Desertivirga arenae TaxID=2810309 RepID=UPI001A9789A1|nr:FAD-dependent oxidoreductase [Pedobacter sp. SYSU D00823]
MSRVIIIGGGIIGLTSAWYLQKSGYEVTIIDKSDLSDNCSYGNAGMIVPSHFVPLAAPGMIEKGIRWMFNSKSPFYVRPSLNAGLFSWGLKFMQNATSEKAERAAIPLRDISLLSKALFEDIERDLGDFGLQENGILMMYKTAKTEEEELHLAEKARSLGLDVQQLSAKECKDLQPGLEVDIKGAVHYKCDAHLYPYVLMSMLISRLEASGVKFARNKAITRIKTGEGKILGIYSGDEHFTADYYVLASGSWSPEVAALAGLKIPMMPGKGYSFMLPEPQKRMHIPALLCEAKVAVTPMNGSIRLGGTMEIDKINSRVNMNRVKGIVESTRNYFPGLKPELPEISNVWYGFRPCSPDGLPYIGRSQKLNNLIVATGHGMMGLSLGPATGKLVSELIKEEKTSLDVSVYSPNRF